MELIDEMFERLNVWATAEKWAEDDDRGFVEAISAIVDAKETSDETGKTLTIKFSSPRKKAEFLICVLQQKRVKLQQLPKGNRVRQQSKNNL